MHGWRWVPLGSFLMRVFLEGTFVCTGTFTFGLSLSIWDHQHYSTLIYRKLGIPLRVHWHHCRGDDKVTIANETNGRRTRG
jgi:hypothetical protein